MPRSGNLNFMSQKLSDQELGTQKAEKRGPNPFVVAGAAFAAGAVLAKLIDWRGHGHAPR